MTNRENRYDVVLDVLDKRITVNVFTKDKVTPTELKRLAIQRGIEFMKEFYGSTFVVDEKDFRAVGYVDRGVFV